MSASSLNLSSAVQLRDGSHIPRLGFGTYESGLGDETYQAVLCALRTGYRHIDTAEWYENEADCGRAVRDFIAESGVPRSEIFYTTKLKVNDTVASATAAINRSLRLSGLDYFDAYLIHGPYPGKQQRLASWTAIEQAVKAGKIRTPGVSNYGQRHLEELEQSGATLRPTINQIELHPYNSHTAEVEFCRSRGIALEAWGPLARGMRWNEPTLKSIAAKHQRPAASILLRWGLQHDFSASVPLVRADAAVILPKSVTPERIRGNIDLYDFELDANDMSRLDGLDEHLVTDWDPIADPEI